MGIVLLGYFSAYELRAYTLLLTAVPWQKCMSESFANFRIDVTNKNAYNTRTMRIAQTRYTQDIPK